MTLPTAADIAAAGDFISAVWAEFALFATILAIAVGLKLGPRVVRTVKSAL